MDLQWLMSFPEPIMPAGTLRAIVSLSATKCSFTESAFLGEIAHEIDSRHQKWTYPRER
jgi:hypothetical protein